jgi:hypothetical protein
MKTHILVFLTILALPLSACSFLSDVNHAAGDFYHGMGDAFENQAARKEGKAPPNDFKGNARRSYNYASSNSSKKKSKKKSN